MSTGAGLPRVLLVDDEPLARLRLRQLLGPWRGEPALAEVVGEAGDAAALQRALAAAGGCELVLLDIALPGPDGLRIAQTLHGQPDAPAVVFVTAHAEHALRAFELDAADYLTKPVQRDRLAAALQRALRWRAVAAVAAAEPVAPDNTPPLVVNDRGRLLRVPLAELLYLKAEHKLVQVVSSRGTWVVDEALGELEQRLGPAVLRVHRNALVAVAAVRALQRLDAEGGPEPMDGWVVRLVSGDELAVSRRQLPAVREVLAGRPPSPGQGTSGVT